LILIGRDCGEDGLRENVSAIFFSLEVGDWSSVFPPLDEMYPRLVAVHGIKHDLKT
jgi:hypothetical protein